MAQSSLAERQELLWRLGDRVGSETTGRGLLAIENGRPIREASAPMCRSTIDIFRYYAGLVRDHGGTTSTHRQRALTYTVREPLGPIAALIPWNSPLISTALKLAPALADRKHGRPEAVGVRRPERRRFVRGRPTSIPARRRQRRYRLRPERRRRPRRPPRHRKISFTGGIETARHILRAAAETSRRPSWSSAARARS